MNEGILIRQDMNRETPELSIDELQRLQFDYPYFQTAKFLYLKKLRHSFPERYPRALQEGALYASDRKSLFYKLEGSDQSWSNLYPDEKKAVTSDSFGLIDSFLATHTTDTSTQDNFNIGNMVNEVPYKLESIEPQNSPEEKDGDCSSFDLVDAFLGKSDKEKKFITDPPPTPTTTDEKSKEELPEEEFLTESLAKIYIKQRRYNKALEIIRKLSLKYPEKNIYFADQIRFLEKLIINIKTE